MSTPKSEIRKWVENGRQNGSTHVIIVMDWFDREDYPVYVKPDQDVYELESEIRDDGDRVMEIYWVEPEADIDRQLNAGVQFTYSEHHSSIDSRQL